MTLRDWEAFLEFKNNVKEWKNAKHREFRTLSSLELHLQSWFDSLTKRMWLLHDNTSHTTEVFTEWVRNEIQIEKEMQETYKNMRRAQFRFDTECALAAAVGDEREFPHPRKFLMRADIHNNQVEVFVTCKPFDAQVHAMNEEANKRGLVLVVRYTQ